MKLNFSKFKFIKPTPQKIESFLRRFYLHILIAIGAILLILSGLFYYNYIHKTINAKIELDTNAFQINSEALEIGLKNLEAREDNLKRVKRTLYPDPFN